MDQNSQLIDLEEVTRKIDLLKVFEYLGITEYKSKKEDLYVRCLNPNHEDKDPSLSINNGRYKGQFNCWSCDFRGKNLVQLVSLVKKITERESFDILCKIAGVGKNFTENEVLDKSLKAKKRMSLIVSKKKEDQEFIEIDLPRNCISAINRKEAEEYRIPNEFVKKYDVKLCTKGYYENRLIFPIYFSNKLVSFLARATWKIDKASQFPLNTKSLYPANAPTGRIIFNYDDSNVDSIVLVEGIKDCIRVQEAGFKSIACFGNKITDEQEILLAKKYKKILILPDRNAEKEIRANPEKDPGMLLVKSIVTKLSHKVDIWVGIVPDDKDPGDCSVEEIKKIINLSKKYTDFQTKEIVKEHKIIIDKVLKPLAKK